MTAFTVIPEDGLRKAVRDNLAAYGTPDEVVFFEPTGMSGFYHNPEPDYQQIRDGARAASRVIVGATGQHANESWAIEAAAEFDKPCGLILKTEQLPIWASMSLVHRLRPFQFVIALGRTPRRAANFFNKAAFFNVFDIEHRRLSELISHREVV